MFDPHAAGRCLEFVKQSVATCQPLRGHDCLDVARGTLPAGAPCTDNGFSCARPARGGAYCDQVCVQVPYGDEGTECNQTCTVHRNSVDCISAGFGNPALATCHTDDGLFCAESGKCEALRAVGEACSEVGCTAGNYCDEVCKPSLDLGARCSSEQACGKDGYCDFNTNACAAKKAHGADCTDHPECLSYHCNAAGKCSDQGPASKNTCGGS